MNRISRSLALTSLWFFYSSTAFSAQAVDFLVGHWCQLADGSMIEETWLPPIAGETVGMGRTIKGEKQIFFDFMRISLVDGVTTFIAQPGGASPVEFSRTKGGEDWVRFENPQHDFPTRIEYRRAGSALEVTISGPGKEDGSESSIPFIYEPCEN